MNLMDMYNAAKAKSSEKGYVAQPLALALELLKNKDYQEGFSDHSVDDLLIRDNNGFYFAYQVKNVLNASLSSLSKSDYDRIYWNNKKGFKTVILLIDEARKTLPPEYESKSIEEYDLKGKHKELWGKTMVVKTNNITSQLINDFDDNFSMEAVFAAIGVAIYKSFNDGTVSRKELLEVINSITIEDVKKAIRNIMDGRYGEIITDEYSKNLSFFKYLENLRSIIDDDADDQYMLYMNLKIVMNDLVNKGFYTLSDFESKMRTLKGEYVLTKAVESPENMYKFLNENSFTFPLIAEGTASDFKVGAAIYWAEVKEKYDFIK